MSTSDQKDPDRTNWWKSLWSRRRYRPIITVAAAVVSAVLAANAAIALAPSDSDPNAGQILCSPGQGLLNYPDHKWECVNLPLTTTPAPTTTGPTVTPTTPVPTTPAPTTVPPTTVPPTTPAPTTPAPTTTGARLTNCMTKLDQCGYPSQTTTGVPVGVTLSTYTGPTTITTAGTVIDSKMMGCITIKAANVVIKRSKIVGPCFWGVNASSGSVRVEDSVIDCTNYKGTGIGGGGFTVLRSQLLRCENGADVAGGNNLIQDSYIAQVKEVDGGHGDGIQAYTAGAVLTNVTVRHNTFDLNSPITSSLIMGYPANNLLVENNFFSAGAYTVYCPNNQPITNVIYRNNRFYGPVGNWQSDPHRPAFGYSDGCNHPGQISWTGNYTDNTLAAVNP